MFGQQEPVGEWENMGEVVGISGEILEKYWNIWEHMGTYEEMWGNIAEKFGANAGHMIDICGISCFLYGFLMGCFMFFSP